MLALILSAMMSTAHAGWWSDFCERHLIADDPYQYQEAPREWIVNQIDILEIKQRWGTITKRELSTLSILQRELAGRE